MVRGRTWAMAITVWCGAWAWSAARTSAAEALPITPPAGFTVVADDDCGHEDELGHVVRGKAYTFPGGIVTGDMSVRTLVFDNDVCVLRYEKLDPKARYKVDVVYVTQDDCARRQRLEANGHLVHKDMLLPRVKPGRFVFDIPAAAIGDGTRLELKFIRTGPGNAVVSRVRIWSTDPKPLRGGRGGLPWAAAGAVEMDWAKQERMRGRASFEDVAAAKAAVDEQLARVRRLVAGLDRLGATGLAKPQAALAALAAAREELAGAEGDARTKTRKAAEGEGSAEAERWLALYLRVRRVARGLVFRHPRLAGREMLLVWRHHPHAMHQCARRLGSFTYPGGGIYVLTNPGGEGEAKLRCVTEGTFPSGTFSRPDVSFDGTRIVFGFAPERTGADSEWHYGRINTDTANRFAAHEVGPCRAFQIYEMPLDGSGEPRKLTEGPHENSQPIYLPDGRIAFMSHRPGGRVQCGDWALAYCVFTMASDGSDVRQLTVSKDGEWDPFLLQDGTIGFTRWEYVMKFWSPIQMIWSVRPDGTNPQIIYGSELGRTYAYPLNYAFSRQVPHTGKVVCIGSAHHNTGAGPVCEVDTDLGRNVAEGLRRVTKGRFVETRDRQADDGWYDCPYPLSEGWYLVSYSFSRNERSTRSYGAYVLDPTGHKELIYRDKELSTMFPAPLGPRARPAVVAGIEHSAEGRARRFGEFLIQDVYEGLPASMRGRAKYVRVVEAHERHIHTRPYNVEVGPDSGFETKTVLGTAEIEPDGSAWFRVPADVSVFFSVLDEQYRALHTMRSVTNLQAGERTSCVGCHEPARLAPANRAPRAARRGVWPLQPPPWGRQPMDYAALIQPLLDRRCIRCHDGTKAKGKAFDLTARQTKVFHGMRIPMSYYHLRKYVRHARIHNYHLPPGSFGAAVSKLPAVLAGSHKDRGVTEAERRLLWAWIDCNAPYLGDFQQVADRRR